MPEREKNVMPKRGGTAMPEGDRKPASRRLILPRIGSECFNLGALQEIYHRSGETVV